MIPWFKSWPLPCLLAALFSAASTAAPPPTDAFFADPVFSAAQLSPDGLSVAMKVGAKGVFTRLAVLDLRTMKPEVVASFANQGIGSIHWINDQRLVFDLEYELSSSGRGVAGPGLYAVDADGSGFRSLMQTVGNFFQDPLTTVPLLKWHTRYLRPLGAKNSNDIYVVTPGEVSKDKVDYFTLDRVNTVNGRAADVDTPLHSTAWTMDADGDLQAVLTRQSDQVEVKVRQADGDWKTVAEYGWFTPKVITPRFIDRDRTLYVEALNGDKVAVFTMDKASGRLSDRPIAASNDFDLHPAFIANDLKLLGLRYLIDAEITQWLDPDLKALQDKIDAILPATANRIDVPRHGDSPWVLVQAFADVQPTVTYAFNRQTARLLLLGRSRPTIERRQMGQTDFIRYKARDGLAIPAYLTLPPGGVKKNLPLVVLVHGGPWSRGATWHWDAEVQFLASRGYAVLQPEFRGSTGFGARHFAAGFREWGRAMQDDIADGARWAIAQSIADPKRICIAGASYGGYATLMGLANDPDLYRCGIEWVGVTDIGLMFSVDWSDMTNEVKHFSLSRLIGDPKVDAERLDAVSPIRNADKIRQPLLMAYGEYDRRVPLVHGEKFRDAVKPHNSQVEWVVYPYEGHGWYRAETRIDFWNRVEKFLALHLGKP